MKNKSKKLCAAFIVLLSMFLFLLSHFKNIQSVPAVPASVSDITYEIIVPKEKSGVQKYDINTVTAEELSEIDGIGKETADKIITFRDETGGISSLWELMEIDGIGEKTVEKLSGSFIVNETEEETTVTETSAPVSEITSLSETDAPKETVSEETEVTEKITQIETPTETETTVREKLYIDLSSATAEELEKLNGIGPATAENIIKYREENGGFSDPSELLNVKGIGEKKYAAIKDNVYVSAPKIKQKESSSAETDTEENTELLININTADKEELMTLDGIGEVIAERIIEYREEHGGFSSIEEIMNVKGIGEKRYENIKDHICV